MHGNKIPNRILLINVLPLVRQGCLIVETENLKVLKAHLREGILYLKVG